MDEIQDLLAKYDRDYCARLLASTPEADQLALTFYEDVAEILDVLSRLKRKEPDGLLYRRRPDTRFARPHVETVETHPLDLQGGQCGVRDYRRTIAHRSGRHCYLFAPLGRIDVGRLPALFLQKQTPDSRTSVFWVQILSQQTWAPALTIDQRKARPRGIGRTQLRGTDSKQLARSGQNVPSDIQGGSGRRLLCRGIRHLLAICPRFLARCPQLLLARERRSRLLAAVRTASRKRRPRFADPPVCHIAVSRVVKKSRARRPVHRSVELNRQT